jgi:hypothetical protein
MDPQLLDLVWAIYKASGSRDEIHVVSAYRSPDTNKMLRSRSSGVAKHSQHTLGKAMDWYVTDVPLDKLRAVAMKLQGGGVGYYPASGSPFIHTDTGSVRAWPRMSRQQLLALFPRGETLHLPADGKPLPGYERAVAQRRSSGSTTLAYLEAEPEEAGSTGTNERGGVGAWLKRVFPGGKDEDGGAETAPTSGAEQLVAATDDGLEPRTPRPRPGTEIAVAVAEDLPRPAVVTQADAQMIATLAFAPLPQTRPDPAFLAASLGDAQAGAALPIASDQLVRPGARSFEPASSEEAAGDPIALAFAAAEGSPTLPSREDSAIIAAFAALHSAAAQKRAVLAAAGPPEATAETTEQTRPLIIAAAIGSPLGVAQQAEAMETETPPAGVVLPASELPGYDADQGRMRRLIAQPAAYDPQFAQLAMPVPSDTEAIYRAPEAAETVADMSGEPKLPVDRFAAAEAREPPAGQGFFMRLFASLIE